MFQEINWVAKLPWAKVVAGCNGKLNMVCCKICIEIDGKGKLLVLKFDNLEKHVRGKICKVARLMYVVG